MKQDEDFMADTEPTIECLASNESAHAHISGYAHAIE